ncbi:hypothetical protein SAMN05216383_10369 [Prevotella sp. KH2C16]|nr:hypothetical protein SAMN05216383_10369 [Prevotella sp. KH2C16]
MITQENFDKEFADPIEEVQIDKFVCKEMSRQIHRYIKGMSGSKLIMERFEERLKDLSLPEKERAIALYIDLNRKVLDGLDFKIVLARAIANYCDTFSYMLALINDKKRMVYYLGRIKDKYIRYHEIYEENGKFGMKDHEGNILVHALYDFLRTPYVYVDDLQLFPIIAEKNGKMGLIIPDGKDTVVADFIYEDISLRDEPPYFEARIGGKVELL